MNDICRHIEECNPNHKQKILVVFGDMIADRLNRRKINPIVTELFIRGRKLSISLVFIPQSCFALAKNIRLKSAHYFIVKIPNKWELQQIASSYHLIYWLWRCYESLQKMHSKTKFFWWLILLLHQTNIYVLEEYFRGNIETIYSNWW